ncbi:hypothetical protein OSTOST_01803 [Ostertagia ostertagi]
MNSSQYLLVIGLIFLVEAYGALGPTRSMLTEGPLGTFRFGKRSGRPERLSRIDQGN